MPASPPRAAAEAVLAIDGAGVVVAWNEAASDLFGWTRDEVLGKPVEATVLPRTAGPSFPAELGAVELPRPGDLPLAAQRLRSLARHRDGTAVPVEVSITPVELAEQTFYTAFLRELPESASHTEQRAIRAAIESRLVSHALSSPLTGETFEEALQSCIGIVCDVTGWKMGHAWLSTSQKECTPVMESSGVWQKRDPGVTLTWTAVEPVRLRRGDELPGRIWDTGEAAWTTNLETHPIVTPLRTAGMKVRGAFGFPVVAEQDIVAVLEFFSEHDVTPDPRLLLLVGSIGQQLGRVIERQRWEEERERLAAIVDSSSDAIISTDLDGCITSWNRGAERVYGHPADEALGQPISMLLPEDHPRISPLDYFLSEGRQQFETLRRHRDGRLMDVSITVSPIRDQHGRVIGLSTIERDVTDRRRREQELQKAKDQAEAASRAKSEFVANISHELRTPMNAIIGMVELTLRNPHVDRSTRDYLVTANDSAHMLLGLVDDLLDFSRMEAGRFELDAEPFDLRRTLDNTMRTLSLRAHARGLELVCRVGSAVPDRLEGDHRRLKQIVMNLVVNAIKFTPQGEVVVSVDLSPENPARGPSGQPAPVELLLAVRDTGIGIGREDRERIFRPFTQVDASLTREQTGAGLGLTICKELVQKMGGRIWVESEPGKGTTFSCTLNLVALPDAPSVTAISSPSWQGRKVLVVDDNTTTQRTLDEVLSHWGFEVRTAGSAREAQTLVEAAHRAGHDFDVLFVDALMPEVDGLSLIEALRTRDLAPQVTFVLGSMADRDIHGDRLKELEIAGAIEKPISQSALFDTLAATLEGPIEGDRAELFSDRTTRPLEILVAEDTPPNQKVVKAILEHRGHRVRIAQNGREALDQAAAEPFDVILMDVQMPTMDGLQATTAIRQLPEPRSRVPIVALTAHAMRRDRERCLSAGMNGYISKPIDAETLIRVVEDLGNRLRQGSNAVPPNPKGTWIMTSAPASSLASGDEPTVNLARALERMGGDRDLLVEMARFYLEDTPGLLQTLRASLQEQKAEEATRAAHSLKGLSANFDAHAAVQTALAVETAGRSGDLACAAALVPDLQAQIDEVSQILRRELKP